MRRLSDKIVFLICVPLVVAVVFVLFAAPLRADSGLSFSAHIQDMPLMPGLVELEDQGLSFDKPQGRIAQSAALMRAGDEDLIRRFYAETLPQLGWAHDGGDSYRRNGEILRFSFESVGEGAEAETVLRFSVGPASDF